MAAKSNPRAAGKIPLDLDFILDVQPFGLESETPELAATLPGKKCIVNKFVASWESLLTSYPLGELKCLLTPSVVASLRQNHP
jgi:hypothetical protein